VWSDLTPNGYKIRVLNRTGKRGGGIAFVHKSALKVADVTDKTSDSMEAMSLTLLVPQPIRIIALYRLHKSHPAFINDFQDLVDDSIVKPASLLILGDFNVHWDDATDPLRTTFAETCRSFGLDQHVTQATHCSGHTLDLVLTRNNDQLLTDVSVGSMISDHFAVHFTGSVAKPHPERRMLSFRKLKTLIRMASTMTYNRLSSMVTSCLMILMRWFLNTTKT
jgi:hypothetical protein